MDFKIYIITFLIIELFYFIFVVMRKKALLKFKESTYVLYLKKIYKIDTDNMNPRILAISITLVNSFILSTSLYIVSNVSGITAIIVAVVSILVLLFGMYHILGSILKKKGDKNV